MRRHLGETGVRTTAVIMSPTYQVATLGLNTDGPDPSFSANSTAVGMPARILPHETLLGAARKPDA